RAAGIARFGRGRAGAAGRVSGVRAACVAQFRGDLGQLLVTDPRPCRVLGGGPAARVDGAVVLLLARPTSVAGAGARSAPLAICHGSLRSSSICDATPVPRSL